MLIDMFDFSSRLLLRRVGAGLIDAALPGFLVLVVWLFGAETAGPLAAVPAVFLTLAGLTAVANGVFLPALTGRTLGCRLFKIKIVSVNAQGGGGIGLISAATRFFGQYGLSILLFFLGYAWSLVNPDGRTWHDLLAGTEVVGEEARPKGGSAAPGFLRRSLSLVLAFLGFSLAASPIWVRPAMEFALASSGLDQMRMDPLPSDFPLSGVLPDEQGLSRRTVADGPTPDTREVRMVWLDLPADPVSALLVYNDSLPLLGFDTRVEYQSGGPMLIFTDSRGTGGAIEVYPSTDLKTVRQMVITVIYKKK